MRVLIIGNGCSGYSASKFLKRKGFETIFVSDEVINAENKFSGKFYDRLFEGLSFSVISPGIDLENHLIKELKKRKIKVIGELELGSKYINGDIIAITGTNGKTTTVSLIGFLLSEIKGLFIGGNIGTPVTSFTLETKKDDVSVLECSSYQLESVKSFHPHIAGILNITEDHLVRHKTMKNYIKSKLKITKNQSSKDFLLLNFDDEILMQNIPKTYAKIYYFSIKQKVIGCYIKNGCIYFNDGLKEKKLVSLKDIKLVGNHNLSNILCSVLAVYLETNEIKFLKRISDFQAIKHRIEFVKNINGISFYNDSKATNIDSTLVAVKSFKSNINLILGGSEKGYEFDKLFQKLPKNVINIAVFGQTKQKIIEAGSRNNFKNMFQCKDIKECILLCYKLSKKGDVVLLSPACASFDHFKNYEERGNVFIKIVKEIDDSESSLFWSEEK